MAQMSEGDTEEDGGCNEQCKSNEEENAQAQDSNEEETPRRKLCVDQSLLVLDRLTKKGQAAL